MAEQRDYEQSSAPRLCANNCGFFASAMTLNLCSKCYRGFVLRENQINEMDTLIPAGLPAIKLRPSTPSLTPSPSSSPSSSPSICCAGECRKRVGLTGFKCKCGATYCATHRLPEDHSCFYDFQRMGKKAIEKANPMIKAPKI